MKKYVGKKWSQLTVNEQVELLTVATPIDATYDTPKGEGERIIDFNDISICGCIKFPFKNTSEYELMIDADAIIYDPTEGIIVENKKFKDLMTIKDACIIYKKEESTLRRNIKNRVFKEWEDCIKFGTTWVFDKKALERVYGR